MVDLYSVGLTTGGAMFIGLLIGGAARHLFRVFAFILGLKIAIITYAEHIGYLDIQWRNIGKDFQILTGIIKSFGSPDGYQQAEVNEVFGIIFGLFVGFIIGFRFA